MEGSSTERTMTPGASTRPTPTVPRTEREPGAPCCLVRPRGALGSEEAGALGEDLELLAHPVRLTILSILARNPEPVCVCDLESLVPVKQPTVSHHLRILREAGLVRSERRGLWSYHSVVPAAWRALEERITRGLGRLEPVDPPKPFEGG